MESELARAIRVFLEGLEMIQDGVNAQRVREIAGLAMVQERRAIVRYAREEGRDLTRGELLEVIREGAYPP